jgi:hypothetical protein
MKPLHPVSPSGSGSHLDLTQGIGS